MSRPIKLSRRRFIKTCALGTTAIAAAPILSFGNERANAFSQTGSASYRLSLDQNWLFGGKYTLGSVDPMFADQSFSKITLPHCVAKLSWQNWNAADWQDVWIYRRHFYLPSEFIGQRVFLNFDGIMVGTTPVINGHTLPQHLGGYLPSQYEITDWLNNTGDNVLAVIVDSQWNNVPPEGSPNGTGSIDFYEPGGIFRTVFLEAVPQNFISDIFAKPVQATEANRHLELTCSVNVSQLDFTSVQISAELKDGNNVIANTIEPVQIDKTGISEKTLSLSNLGNINLWDVDSPNLYDIVVTLLIDGSPVHNYKVRTGLRDAHFEIDGFYLNGRRLQLFGLDRHELFPYVGFAMPPRVMKRDVQILKQELNCNMVRCSHYPQSKAFYDACDELGLLAWEEVPGWQYIGDSAWKDLLVRDVKNMVVRDRNHPSIVIWGVRANETANDADLYQTTKDTAKALDDSRQTSGAMRGGEYSTSGWYQDVFAFNDYNGSNGQVKLKPPLAGVPYLITETVAQYNYPQSGFNLQYRRAGDVAAQMLQAIFHAEAHDQGMSDNNYAGVLAWSAFNYPSPLGSTYNGVKYPGVADLFRIPKLGAAFYQSQISPQIRPVIQPNFYWDFGQTDSIISGKSYSVFSNCDRLELFIDGKYYNTIYPDSNSFPHLKYPPSFIGFVVDGSKHPELRIDGYVNSEMVLSKLYSSDTSQDQLYFEADDEELIGDGVDATRLVVKVTDKYGSQRLHPSGDITFGISGAGTLVGDNPFPLSDSGGAGAVWVKSSADNYGNIIISATHSSLGTKTVDIRVLLTDVEKTTTQLPVRYELSQNYPNPFNSTTVIKYSISKRSFISLKVYDILGEEVTTLFSGIQWAGDHIIKFNGDKYSSGVYLLKLQADGFTAVKKMLLLK